jgi:hypothetical protein
MSKEENLREKIGKEKKENDGTHQQEQAPQCSAEETR